LLGVHRAVVELKVDIADVVAFLVPDLTIGRGGVTVLPEGLGQLRHAGEVRRQHDGGWQLEVRGVTYFGPLEMADPHGPVTGSSAHRAPSSGHQLTWRAAKISLPMGPV
jgi:hypothetical protein